jgi:hypothetical protein
MNEPMHEKRIGTATRTDPLRPGMARRSPKTPVLGALIRDAGLWAVCPGRESSCECHHRILPLGTLVEKISDFSLRLNEKDPRDRQSSRHRPSLRLRFPGWRRSLTIRCRHSSCSRSNRRSRTSSWIPPITKIRNRARYVTKAVLVVAGVREDGYGEILSARITDCENEGFWLRFSEDLKERGLLGFNWSSRMGMLASRRRLRPPFLGAS